MTDIVQGRVWKFGDNINTDVITPSVYMALPMDEMKQHVLERVRPEFVAQMKPGDVIVAGINFGCGSSREQSPAAIKALGAGAVVAESFSRIFFRTSIAIGLPIAVCPGVSANFDEGDILRLDMFNANVTNVNNGKTYPCEPLPKEMLEVVSKGGIVNMLKELSGKK